jgi:YVTN family beta-propeller protein
VVGHDSNNIFVIDTSTNTLMTPVNVGLSSSEVAVTSDGKIYATNSRNNTTSVIDAVTNKVTDTVPVRDHPSDVAVSPDGTKVYVTNAESDNVSVIDTATNKVTATVNAGKYTLNYPTKVAIGPFTDSNMVDQSTRAISNVTEDIGIKETNLSSSKVKNVVLLNNSNNSDSEFDNSDSSSGNESSKNNSTPGFGLLGGLTSLYGGWKLRKN